MNILPLQGRVAMVAGASKGIGAATAEAFAAAGAAVVLGARDLEALNRVAERIRGNDGRALAVRTDVSDVPSMREFTEAALAEYGRLDAAFNNVTDGRCCTAAARSSTWPRWLAAPGSLTSPPTWPGSSGCPRSPPSTTPTRGFG